MTSIQQSLITCNTLSNILFEDNNNVFKQLKNDLKKDSRNGLSYLYRINYLNKYKNKLYNIINNNQPSMLDITNTLYLLCKEWYLTSCGDLFQLIEYCILVIFDTKLPNTKDITNFIYFIYTNYLYDFNDIIIPKKFTRWCIVYLKFYGKNYQLT